MTATRQQQQLRGELRLDEPMSRHTSWRVGGPADRFYRPADLADAMDFLRSLPAHEPVTWCGLGSNLLVRDGGVRGTVISTPNRLGQLELIDEHTVRAEAGVPCAKVAKFCARAGLIGAEFLAGIPGTMGGALAMNAGAYGGETWERVSSVQTLDRSGRLHERTAEEFEIGYRHVRGPADEYFVSATLTLDPGGDPAQLSNRIRELLAQRGESQPTNQPSCGSVFRNPPGDHAARLIEQAGLKGFSIGGAQVSEKHANFIINTGDALAADIEALIAHLRAAIGERYGIDLMPEVRVVGEAVK